mmetsp:Transcript_40027/g.72112  ORF Transcript_40027/g.72112 Transcript_40027/m.72112 type:complete len:398 (+) Transcript_40027:606-1799(+)
MLLLALTLIMMATMLQRKALLRMPFWKRATSSMGWSWRKQRRVIVECASSPAATPAPDSSLAFVSTREIASIPLMVFQSNRAFAVVKKATHKSTGNPYAIKIVNRSSLNKDMEFALKDEISILKELNHEHIMRLENVVVTINHYYLVAEYLEGGELFDRIVDKSSYTESEARDVCRILFGALSYIHSKGIVHRDLKPENLLLQNKDSDSEIKIADFGFAKEASNGDHSLKTMCGTPGYVAPEILRREKYGTKVDMWSMGVIVFILLGGYPPFYADSPRQLCLLSKVGKFEFDPEYWGGISMGAKDMICSLLVTDPAKRASAEDILSHPWMREDTYKLKCMSLSKTQVELKKYIARMRFKKAIHSILFVNTFTGQNAIFSGTNKRKAIKTLEDLGVFC